MLADGPEIDARSAPRVRIPMRMHRRGGACTPSFLYAFAAMLPTVLIEIPRTFEPLPRLQIAVDWHTLVARRVTHRQCGGGGNFRYSCPSSARDMRQQRACATRSRVEATDGTT